MFDHLEPIAGLPAEATGLPEMTTAVPTDAPTTDAIPVDAGANGDWHAEAGRKGARRLQELIEEGKRYEQQHGLKRGRQRIRQLVELGKRYEQENGLRPQRSGKRRQRLSHGERDELLTTLVQCLVRIAKPSFRPELTRLLDALQAKPGQAA